MVDSGNGCLHEECVRLRALKVHFSSDVRFGSTENQNSLFFPSTERICFAQFRISP